MDGALTKAALVDSLYLELGLNKHEAKAMVELFFEEIRLALEEGHPIKISGLGNFTLRDKAARPGRNPKTDEVVMVSPRRVVTFHAGQKLKHRIEQSVVADSGDQALGEDAE
jgi:integration host factor subunit alpha